MDELLFQKTKTSILRGESLVFVEIAGDTVTNHCYPLRKHYAKAKKHADRLRPRFLEKVDRWLLYSRDAVLREMKDAGWIREIGYHP